jgi:hypothetical protein
LGHFLKVERALRLGYASAEKLITDLPAYWRQLADVLRWHSLVKRGLPKFDALQVIPLDSPYRVLIEQQVPAGTFQV